MKKVWGFFAGSAVLAGSLYVGSEKLVADELDQTIISLKSYGFEIEDLKKEGSNEHFNCYLQDKKMLSKAFPQLQSFLQAIPSKDFKDLKFHIDSTVQGPKVSLTIYPIASKDESDKAKAFLAQKKLQLNIYYNSLTKHFSGDLKDIDEQSGDMVAVVKGVNFEGDRDQDVLKISYNVERLSIGKDQQNIFSIEGVQSAISYKGKRNEIANGQTTIDAISFRDTVQHHLFDMKNISIGVSSDDHVDLIDSAIDIKADAISIQDKQKNINLKGVGFAYGVYDVDKATYLKLAELLDKSRTVSDPAQAMQNQDEVVNTMIALFAKGMRVEVDKLGADSITIDGEDFGQALISLKLKVKDDPDLLQKIQISPMLAASSTEIDANLQMSDKIYTKLMQDKKGAMLGMVPPKVQNGLKTYHLLLKDGQMSVNGQMMR